MTLGAVHKNRIQNDLMNHKLCVYAGRRTAASVQQHPPSTVKVVVRLTLAFCAFTLARSSAAASNKWHAISQTHICAHTHACKCTLVHTEFFVAQIARFKQHLLFASLACRSLSFGMRRHRTHKHNQHHPLSSYTLAAHRNSATAHTKKMLTRRASVGGCFGDGLSEHHPPPLPPKCSNAPASGPVQMQTQKCRHENAQTMTTTTTAMPNACRRQQWHIHAHKYMTTTTLRSLCAPPNKTPNALKTGLICRRPSCLPATLHLTSIAPHSGTHTITI